MELTRVEDTDPGPPFAVLVSTIRIVESGNYKLTGRIRNDGSAVYGGVGVGATFYTELECGQFSTSQGKAKRGQPVTTTVGYGCGPSGHRTGKVYGACQLLAPGAECPFSLEIYPREYVSYHLHADATRVEYRRPAPLVVTNLSVYDGWIGYVRITGTATNENPFPVRDATIAGTLLDAAGQIVSVGSAIVPGEIAPGANVSFDLHIVQAPYTHYELEAQATQD